MTDTQTAQLPELPSDAKPSDVLKVLPPENRCFQVAKRQEKDGTIQWCGAGILAEYAGARWVRNSSIFQRDEITWAVNEWWMVRKRWGLTSGEMSHMIILWDHASPESAIMYLESIIGK